MSLIVEIAPRVAFNRNTLNEMHRLRAKVFRGRMGWDVSVIGGMEIDGYDAIDPLYMLMREPDGILRGCWRLLPTVGPYMLKDTFPELLHGALPPEDPSIWELSRFAIETGGEQVFGFSSITMQTFDEVIAYGNRVGIKQYLTVTTTAMERMLRRTGLNIKRYGPAIKIGVENAVAILIDIEGVVTAKGNNNQATHYLN